MSLLDEFFDLGDGKAQGKGCADVLAWVKRDDREEYRTQHAIEKVGLLLRDRRPERQAGLRDGRKSAGAEKEDHAWPPIYYPGTFSRSEAKLITFDSGRSVENVNITRRKKAAS